MKHAQRQILPILSDIRSLQNVGSIFRTCDGLGIPKIICVGTTGHPYPESPWRRDHLALTKTALGAEKHIVWEYQPDLLKLIDQLKQDQWLVVCLERSSKASDLLSWHHPVLRIALILGPEKDGLSETVQNLSDATLALPMVGHKESYNVAVAFGMAALWLQREA